MKVLVVDKFPDKRIAEMKEAGFDVDYQPTLKDGLDKAVKGFDVLVVRSTKVPAAVIDSGDALKMIIRAGSGTNTIDVKEATAKGIHVANTPGKNSVAVAELTMGLILAMDRHIPDNVADLRAGKWNKKGYSKASGLKGQTLGLIGFGAIGKEVAARAKAFGMRIIASDPFVSKEKGAEFGAEMMSQDDVIKNADIISLHAPAIPETEKMVNSEFLAKMKKGALIINAARAELFDIDAVMKAVKEDGLRVAMDVPPNEPKDKEGSYSHEIFSLPGVYGTHHIGASTDQAQDAVAEEVIRMLKVFRDEGKALNTVNKV